LNLSRTVNSEGLEETLAAPRPLVLVTNTADDSATESETEPEPESEHDHKNSPAAPVVDQKAHNEFTSTDVQAANNMADDSVTESETEPESEPNHESNHHTVCSSYIFCDMIPYPRS